MTSSMARISSPAMAPKDTEPMSGLSSSASGKSSGISTPISMASATTPVSAIDGSRRPDPQPAAPASRVRAHMSLASKAALLALIFLVVPVILYDQFRAADQQKRQLVMNSVRDQGHTISVALSPMLNAAGAPNLPTIGHELGRFDNQLTTAKLLYQPAADASQG